MLGPPKLRDLTRSVPVSLETYVPADNFYRHLDAQLDLSFVRVMVKDCYAAIGRPSIDPIVFFRLQLIMFFEGIRSERKLIETAGLHLAHRWYLGYHFDEPLPDHSSLTRIRDRFGLTMFRRFFEEIVAQCKRAGLVWGKELYFDATKVQGNAAMDSLVPRLREVVDDHLVELFTRDALDEDGVAAGADVVQHPAPAFLRPPAPVSSGEEDGGESKDTPAEEQPMRWDPLEECRLDPNRPFSQGYQRLSDRKVSRTDPDATPMVMADKRTALGYQDHYVVDGGKHRIILAALTMPADVMENQPMLDLLRRVIFRYHLRPRRAIGDTTYGTVENIRALEEMGIRAYVPLPDWDHRNDYFGSSQFSYDAARDVYVCPQGELLRRSRTEYTQEKWEYQADAATCNACPLKAKCTPSEQGRQLHRSFHAAYLDRVRGYHHTAAYQKAMRKRKVWVEPLFGEAKQWHGLEQFRLRGRFKVNMAGLLIAAGQNLKRLLSATGWGRRHAPCGSLLAPFCLDRTRSSPLR